MATKPTLTIRRFITPNADKGPIAYPAGTEGGGGTVFYTTKIDGRSEEYTTEQLNILASALVGRIRMIATMGKQTEEVIRQDNMHRLPTLGLLMSFFDIDGETFALLQAGS